MSELYLAVALGNLGAWGAHWLQGRLLNYALGALHCIVGIATLVALASGDLP